MTTTTPSENSQLPDQRESELTPSSDGDLEKGSPKGSSELEAAASPAESTRPGAKAGLTLKQFWIVMLGLNVGMFLTALDFNIIATAVPIISSEFQSYQNSSWLGTAYLVSFALVLPIYGKLSDVFGRRNLFVVATFIFILGSGLCGGAKDIDMLIASRVVQGLGGGGIYGLVNVIVTDLVPLQHAGKYISFTGLVWAIADVAGPLLGGAFSQYATWRWCFYINLCISPISLAITLLVLKLPEPKTNMAEKSKGYDYGGTLALVGGTTMILLGISWGGVNFAWKSGQVIGTLIGGVVLLVVFVIVEHFVKDPLLPPSFLRRRAIVAMFFAEFFYGANLLGMMYYVPQFFQLVFGDSAVISGVGLLPLMLGLAVGNPIAGFITSKWGISLANAWVGAALEVLASGLITRWNAGTSRTEAVIELIILGVGQGAAMEGLLISSQAAVTPMLIGAITGLVIFMQTVGDIFGIAIFAALYQNQLRSTLGKLDLSQMQISSILHDITGIRTAYSGQLKTDIISSYADSLKTGWWLMFACAAALLISSAFGKQHKFTS
ncbi:hypothetical protein AJ79_03636 [Helicocarpus griseus UAMH5409]|uniref:Major facilitator superfamily (MFS) profile domain-containing protein n=1 Tax=Helicocarpus griseus UAMH5409 TaxID=1447875 RepID=A0A2B7XWD2_9EURO|nr:hypothetical protein AJ79_03636 [Helicocarpus griseus UAMH5409]